MITMSEKLAAQLDLMSFSDVRTLYINRARIESGRRERVEAWLLDNGFELLDVPGDALLTADGREILRAHGRAWALLPEIHTQRLAEAVEHAKQQSAAMKPAEPSTTKPTTCTTLIDGQLCGGTLVRASVCPRCALGKSGVAATLTCDVCGHVTAIMRGAK